jgi:hypothetical protein
VGLCGWDSLAAHNSTEEAPGCYGSRAQMRPARVCTRCAPASARHLGPPQAAAQIQVLNNFFLAGRREERREEKGGEKRRADRGNACF